MKDPTQLRTMAKEALKAPKTSEGVTIPTSTVRTVRKPSAEAPRKPLSLPCVKVAGPGSDAAEWGRWWRGSEDRERLASIASAYSLELSGPEAEACELAERLLKAGDSHREDLYQKAVDRYVGELQSCMDEIGGVETFRGADLMRLGLEVFASEV